MSVLQSECGFFIRETELLRFGPQRRNFTRGAARSDQRNCGVQILAAALVSIYHRVRSVAYGEAPVVTRAVAHVGMQNVVVNRITGAQNAVGKNMRMRIAAFAGNRIHSLNVFRAEIVENLAYKADP